MRVTFELDPHGFGSDSAVDAMKVRRAIKTLAALLPDHDGRPIALEIESQTRREQAKFRAAQEDA